MSMHILNHALSPLAEDLLVQIEEASSKEIYFHTIEELGISGQSSYGALDFSRSDSYHVYLSTQLTGEPFEANMLHELRHIMQIELGFPTVCNKDVACFKGSERPFFEEIGRHLQSVILDIEVWNWLTQQGLDIHFFTKKFYKGVIPIVQDNYTKLSDKFNLANYVCQMVMAFSNVTELKRTSILKETKFNIDAVQQSDHLSQTIKQIGCSTPAQAAQCMALLLDELDIWDTYCIRYNNSVYDTSESFHSQFD